MDLFEPGSGSPPVQVHDFNGGTLESGLFWTLALDDDALDISSDGRRAVLDVEDISVFDSFTFGGPHATPATVSFHIEWKATEPFVQRGRGAAVPATDAAAFSGRFARALSTASFSGSELGFGFRSDPGPSSARAFAEMGRERNGSFL